MAADHAVLLGTQAFDGALAREVEIVGAPAHYTAAQRFKRMGEHQQLAGGVDMGALAAGGIPGVANLDALDGRHDVVKAGGAQHLAGAGIGDRKSQAVAGLQGGLYIGPCLMGFRHRSDAQLPELAIAGGSPQPRFVLQPQWH